MDHSGAVKVSLMLSYGTMDGLSQDEGVGFNFIFRFSSFSHINGIWLRLKTQFSGIKITTVYRQSIFTVTHSHCDHNFNLYVTIWATVSSTFPTAILWRINTTFLQKFKVALNLLQNFVSIVKICILSCLAQIDNKKWESPSLFLSYTV